MNDLVCIPAACSFVAHCIDRMTSFYLKTH